MRPTHREPGLNLRRPARQHTSGPSSSSATTADFQPEGQRDYLIPKNVKSNEFYDRVSGSLAHRLKRHVQRVVHFLVEDWFLSALLGTIIAVVAICVDISIEYLTYYKVELYDQVRKNKHLSFLCWTGYVTLFVALACLCCKYISKQAVGSGIPQLKVIMNGHAVPNYLSGRTMVAKAIGMIAAIGSGLPIGKEGSFVHIGSILGVGLSRITQRVHDSNFISAESREFQNILSGCAVGIACTFSSPAGAVMYAIECTHKYFAVKHYWRSFFATTVGALVVRYANAWIAPAHVGETILAHYETHLPNEVFVAEELPVFIVLGIACGLLGALFIIIHNSIFRFYETNKVIKRMFGHNSHLMMSILAAAAIGLVTWPSGFGQYIGGRYMFRDVLSDFTANCTMSDLNNTANSCHNDIVFRWMSVDGQVVPSLFRFLAANYFVAVVCLTLALPASTFIPAFILGACGGRILGEIMYMEFPEGIRGSQINPGLYAVVGAAAFAGAVTQSFSIAVIVCEATRQLCGLLPVLVALMAANMVSRFLTPSLYESIIRLRHYPHLIDLPPSRINVSQIKVRQIMVTNFAFISRETTYRELRDLLVTTPNARFYPLVNNPVDMILQGSVSRKYLYHLITTNLGPDPLLIGRQSSRTTSDYYTTNNGANNSIMRRNSTTNTNSILTGRCITGNTLLMTSPLHEDYDTRNNPLAPLLRKQTETDLNAHVTLVDRSAKMLQPIEIDSLAVDQSPFQLVLNTSLYKVHTLFTQLELNHAFVVSRGRLVGLVGFQEIQNALTAIYEHGKLDSRHIHRHHQRRYEDRAAPFQQVSGAL